MALAEANANHVENREGFHLSATQTLYLGSPSLIKQVVKPRKSSSKFQTPNILFKNKVMRKWWHYF